MKYEIGSYIVRSRKGWKCEICHNFICYGEFYFVRIKAVVDKFNEWKRYHKKCALANLKLNQFEKDLIAKTKDIVIMKESNILQSLMQILRKYEAKGLLTFFRAMAGKFRAKEGTKDYYVGRRGFSDLFVFLKGGQTLFIEIKSENKIKYSEFQIEFIERIRNLGFEYHTIRNFSELHSLLEQKGVSLNGEEKKR